MAFCAVAANPTQRIKADRVQPEQADLSEPMDYLYSLPPSPAPNDNPGAIQGSAPVGYKAVVANVWAWQSKPGNYNFGNGVARRARIVETNLRNKTMGSDLVSGELEAEVIAEITVGEGMMNDFGFMSGPCAIYLLEFVTLSSCICLGLATGIRPEGVSTNMEVQWHGPAPQGTVLRLVGTTIAFNKRSSTCRGEIYDKGTGKLLVSFKHIVAALRIDSKVVQSYVNQQKSRL
ncbi:hypothetical protein BXZ70DRAFT_945245 [Cristinia sonorae]|uniref:Thioesterase domain-containing protein n=1 Tax=Cristinia sonorae TaxID=1940300 RepID=A0A8K0UL54_9AGAR|nr:hypothetical protein BXZ70DRAFT_945245 [Cristinia sonorae]